MRISLMVLISLFVVQPGKAQFYKKVHSSFFYKSNRFFETDVYTGTQVSDASARGLGIGLHLPEGRRFRAFATYSLALSKNLPGQNHPDSRLYFHDANLNVGVNLIQIPDRFNLFVYIGYGVSKLTGSETIRFSNGGVHSNFGSGLDFKLSDKLALIYRLDFSLQYKNIYPHYLENSIGLRFSIAELHKTHKENVQVQIIQADTHTREPESESRIDSLQNIQLQLIREIAELKASLITLERLNMALQKENGTLINESRYHNLIADSMIFRAEGAYSVLDSQGNILDLHDTGFLHGYYIVSPELYSLNDAVELNKKEPFSTSDQTLILNRENSYYIIALLETSLPEAITLYMNYYSESPLYQFLEL